jgi:hypothetical protein
MFVAFKKVDPLTNDLNIYLSLDGMTWTVDTTNYTTYNAISRLRAIQSYTEIPDWDVLFTCRNTPFVEYIGANGVAQTAVTGFNVNCVFYSHTLKVLLLGTSNSNTIIMANSSRTGVLQTPYINITLPVSMTVKDIVLCNGNHMILSNGSIFSYYYSKNMNTFQTANLPSNAEWHFASQTVRGYSKRVVGVSSNGFIIYSDNGINWTTAKNYSAQAIPESRNFANIKYIEELKSWVAVDETRKVNAAVYSFDGITWFDIVFSSAVSLCDVTFSPHLDCFLFLSLPVDSTGNVVAITTLPKLPTSGTVLKTGAFTMSHNGGIYNAGANISNPFLSNTNENTPLIALSINSAYKPSTSTWTINSDERLKENIELMDLDECVNVVENLDLKHYKWKDEFAESVMEEDKHKLGWIAQELEELMPDAVLNMGSMMGIEDMKTINTDQLIAVMYGSIQNLMERYEIVKNKLEEMN